MLDNSKTKLYAHAQMSFHIPCEFRRFRGWAFVLGYGIGLWSVVGASAGDESIFEDVTQLAGVDFLHWDRDPRDSFIGMGAPYMCGGAAAGDYDQDGWSDLYVTRVGARNLLFRNRGDGTFQESGTLAGVDLQAISAGCAWADVNNDGWLDLYVLTVFDRARLYLNLGGRDFEECAVARGVDVAWGTSTVMYTSPTFADYDRDGDLDLLVLAWSPVAKNRLLRNDGTGHFEDVTEEAGFDRTAMWGFSAGFADVNGDGWDDILVAADYGTSRLYLNDRGILFRNATIRAGVGTDENGMGSAVADVDNDGDLDWFVTSIFDARNTCDHAPCNWGSTGNRLFLNNGDATFEDGTDEFGVRDGGWGWGASFFDFDNDADLDLAMTNGVNFPFSAVEDWFNRDPLCLWENDGLGRMTEVGLATGFVDNRPGKGMVVFDYDGDGDLDVFIVNTADRPILLRNNVDSGHGWLRISLRGRASNGRGLGAQIRVRATESGPTQMRVVNGNSNYMSHNEAIAHFGLGSHSGSVFEVTTFWPASGMTTRIRNAMPNRRLEIEEISTGDFDADRVVTRADFPGWSACFTGPGGGVPSDVCLAADFDADGDVDLADFGHLELTLAGS